jgi:hypothetical protein
MTAPLIERRNVYRAHRPTAKIYWVHWTAKSYRAHGTVIARLLERRLLFTVSQGDGRKKKGAGGGHIGRYVACVDTRERACGAKNARLWLVDSPRRGFHSPQADVAASSQGEKNTRKKISRLFRQNQMLVPRCLFYFLLLLIIHHF